MKLYFIAKRLTDFVFALLLLIFLTPVMLICAVLIKLEDRKGPIFFRQARIGKNCKVFNVVKFRSMRLEAGSGDKHLSDSERMLKIGFYLRKLSLDELPQLYNIIKGEMSFIGPRPLPVVYYPYFRPDELRRHSIMPGISGLAQVNGRNFLSWDDRFKFDLEYVDKVNLLLDLKILMLTIQKVLRKSDVGVRGVDFPDVSLYDIRPALRNDLQTSV